MPDNKQKVCAILLAMGGPDSLDDIPEYLHNIFSDRSIIRLPGGSIGQKILAKVISRSRSEKVKEHYAQIGGSSPLLKWTEIQKGHIEFTLCPILSGFKCYIGMRYFKPTIKTAIDQAIVDGFENIIFVPMYPQYCKATTGSSFLEAKKVLSDHPHVEPVFISDYHNNSSYLDLLKKYIDINIADDELLIFSAHSIPQKFVDEGDPYVKQINKCAKLAAVNREYQICFQSRTGPVKWVGPNTVDLVKQLVNEQNKKLFIVPISFVCDHIETLHELDIELPAELDKSKQTMIRRMLMFNDDINYGAILSQLILDQVNG